MRVVIVLALVGAALAAPQHEFWNRERKSQRIVGGFPVIINEYPYMTQLLVRSWSQFTPICGASLISTRAALSAAHCFINEAVSTWRIRVGSSFTNSGGEILFIDEFIPHPGYIAEITLNDVGIVKMSSSVVLSNTVGIASLASPGTVIPDNALVTAIGFGTLRFDAVRPSTLQRVNINVIDQNICAARYAYLKTIPEFENIPTVTPDMFCTGILDVGGKGTCGGDSGGPIIYNSNVVGIISWGQSCAQPYFPGVNVRVASYYEWITLTANLNEEQ